MPKQITRAELVGAFGDPIDENPTGIMQEAGFAARGLDFRYLSIKVKAGELAAALHGLRAMNFRGINCTIPHKVEVLKYLDAVAPDAKLIGAVNTLVNDGGKLTGHNTDGKGFLRSVQDDAGVDVRGKRVVFLGAGGAARAMSVELALADASHITIVNGDEARGQDLAQLLNQSTKTHAEFVPWRGEYAIPENADIVVNATPVGLYPDVGNLPAVNLLTLRRNLLVCDVIPNPPNTAFLQAARSAGARTLDGLGMLVYQGAAAFKLWTGVDAPVDVMRKALENVFG
jgi:shikimate dehydrogenase